jgi:ubiquinone/menaquinone biosynthesis C-methylase UbiE
MTASKFPEAMQTNADPAALQREFYIRTADDYDSAHMYEGSAHDVALGYATSLFESLGIRSILDVGTGTGRIIRCLSDNEDLHIVGVEPVPELLERAVAVGVPAQSLVRGSGFQLPFPDASFDAVIESAVLHHLPDPAPMVREMTRVARTAVFLSDDNRFGRGRLSANLLKLAIYRAGLWPAFYRLKTKGKGYQVTDDDGISYSYSVYDSYEELSKWADRVVFVPTGVAARRSWMHPLLTTPHALLCAVKGEPKLPWLRVGRLEGE